MMPWRWISMCNVGMCTLSVVLLTGCSLPEPPQSESSMPAIYADHHMPEGWWTDEKALSEGRQLYIGAGKKYINCAKCHGKDGKPVKGGARDFRNVSVMKTLSDSHLFWRISEGVPYSTMRGFKELLTEEEIWKVVAYISTFSMKGKQYDPRTESWVPAS